MSKHATAGFQDSVTDEGPADEQTTFSGEWHADQTRLSEHTDDACDCDDLPGEWPCAECYIAAEATIPEDY